MRTMHGGIGSAQKPPDRDRSRLGQNQCLGGATQRKTGRGETRSEAEGKIETDFLAGVKTIDQQMI